MSLPTGYKRFNCDRCGYKFIQRISSPVISCKKCQSALVSVDFKGKRLDPYAELKLYWLKHPKAWEDNIKHRKNNKMDDNRKLPEIVEW